MTVHLSPIGTVMDAMGAAWRAGDGARFAEAFAPAARFVAFDGTVLTGPAEIAAFHQAAFDTHLQGTALHLAIQEIRDVGSDAWLVFTTARIERPGAPAADPAPESVQTFLVRQTGGAIRVEAFQNTRIRPVADAASAAAWRAFDRLWADRHG